MNTFRFINFPVYQSAKTLYKKILVLTEEIKNYSFKDQIQRASLSVVLNIAEGSAKKSDKDFARFIQTSLGSISEVVACLDILREVKSTKSKNCDVLISEYEEVAKQLGGFIKKLHSDG
ncbi:MAG: hypothetical protein UT48_C0028G0001 [Parcubacteria group bacterium GW2011_GWE2_39_37]|uniref:S23 ribosomal protein n=1 Tax=Candidatus Falkowbacteria bacterium GW2011_GWF2_39_8 TaxID=1618642 RepID=A0A0G0PY94_9BACT|nr:MAG: hypothetical protein UT48_C0028G0001 [Parcubacteria group bacterium GW2011_GWE2_39_37]KKR33094.1 MAG: hypothetical protein UT64_C0015G0006 [Candidatus Falkowbacteria bacterium GW2011_GWF2_39_8]